MSGNSLNDHLLENLFCVWVAQSEQSEEEGGFPGKGVEGCGERGTILGPRMVPGGGWLSPQGSIWQRERFYFPLPQHPWLCSCQSVYYAPSPGARFALTKVIHSLRCQEAVGGGELGLMGSCCCQPHCSTEVTQGTYHHDGLSLSGHCSPASFLS